ncbi:MAG: hypothetical protein JWP09_228 [Candidatus Taylorbacteria bacterium]|nr:hypothetical protein [Candidatus Taylorbacteria bacterium]
MNKLYVPMPQESKPREYHWFVAPEVEQDPEFARALVVIRRHIIQGQLKSILGHKLRYGKSDDVLRKDERANQLACEKLGHEPGDPIPPNPEDKSGTGGLPQVYCKFCGVLLPLQS